MLVLALFALASVAATPLASVSAQTEAKKALGVDDYSRWRAIGNQAISGDGKWVTYVLSQTNTAPADAKPVLHILNLDSDQDLQVSNATAPAFSSDSKWIAYEIDSSAGGRGRGGRGGGGGGATPPGGAAPAGQGRAGASTPVTPPRRVELRNLATGALQSWQDMQSFSFAAN